MDSNNRQVAGGKIFDENGNPVHIAALLRDVIISDDDLRAIDEQTFWSFQKRYAELDAEETITFLIAAGATKEMHVYLTIDATSAAYFDSYQESTITNNGTARTVFDMYINPGETPSPEGVIYETPTVAVAGTKRFEKVIPAGGKFSSGGTGGLRTKTILAPGVKLYTVITNKTANGTLGVSWDFYEQDPSQE